MQLFFIDESGSIPPKDKIKNDYFILGGVIISEEHWFDVSKELNKIKEKYEINGEIKWRYFAPQKGAQLHSMSHLNAEKKEELRSEPYKIITKYKSIKIISSVVNIRKAYEISEENSHNNIYWHAYKQMTERFQYYLQDLSRLVGAKINGIIICDHRMPKDDDEIKDLHQKLLNSKNENRLFYQNLVEGVFMAPSHYSVGIQFADLVAGAIHRKVTKNDLRFFNLIEKSFRRSPTGNIEGYGLIKWPKDQ